MGLNKRNLSRVHIVNIPPKPLNPRPRRPKQPIPNPSLLPIILTLLPPLPMMQIMVLNHKFHIQHPQQERQWIDRRRLNPQSTMPQQLREDHILRAEPPVVEVDGKPHELHSPEGHERDTHNIKKLLRRVRVAGEERVRVFGEMVRAVKSPETQVLVHHSVVPVVVEVEDDGVHADFEGEPEPVQRRGTLICAVGHGHGHHGTEGDDGDQGVHCFLNAYVWDAVAFVLVAVEEAVAFADAAEDV